jgi:hypothetical protein
MYSVIRTFQQTIVESIDPWEVAEYDWLRKTTDQPGTASYQQRYKNFWGMNDPARKATSHAGSRKTEVNFLVDSATSSNAVMPLKGAVNSVALGRLSCSRRATGGVRCATMPATSRQPCRGIAPLGRGHRVRAGSNRASSSTLRVNCRAGAVAQPWCIVGRATGLPRLQCHFAPARKCHCPISSSNSSSRISSMRLACRGAHFLLNDSSHL